MPHGEAIDVGRLLWELHGHNAMSGELLKNAERFLRVCWDGSGLWPGSCFVCRYGFVQWFDWYTSLGFFHLLEYGFLSKG